MQSPQGTGPLRRGGPATSRWWGDRRLLGTAAIVVALAVLGGVAVTGSRPTALLPTGSAEQAGAPSPSVPAPGHEVYGFVPYWEIDDTIAPHLRETAASTVALFSVTHDGKGRIATKATGYDRATGPVARRIIADAHDAGRRVDLTWTSFGRTKNASLFGSEALQGKVIDALLALRSDLGVDGIAVDVETIDDADIPAFGRFVGRLRGALQAADPAATVTVATGAGRQGSAMALAATLAGADRIFLMGYDYRIGGSDPGGTAPLFRRDGEERSLSWSVELYAAVGVPAERTILGLPLYGMAWQSSEPWLGAPANGRGTIWVPRQNLEAMAAPGTTPGYDTIEEVGFLAVPRRGGWQAIYYDTPRSLRPKLAVANDRGFAGAGFWALGYERGLPGYDDLIAEFRQGRTMGPEPTAPEPTTVPPPPAGDGSTPAGVGSAALPSASDLTTRP